MRRGRTSGVLEIDRERARPACTGPDICATVDTLRLTVSASRFMRCGPRAAGSACDVALLTDGDTLPTENGAENGSTISVTSTSALTRDSVRIAKEW